MHTAIQRRRHVFRDCKSQYRALHLDLSNCYARLIHDGLTKPGLCRARAGGGTASPRR